MLELDDIQHFLLTRAPALTARMNFCRFAKEPAAAPGCRQSRRRSFRCVDARRRRSRQALGDGGFHLERASRAGTGRGFARVIPGGVQAGHGGAGGDARRCRRERPRTLGRRAREPRPARDRHSLRAGRGRARPLRLGAREACRQLPRRRGPVRARPSTPFRRSTTRTTISATATGCRSRPSKGTAWNRRRAPASR